MKRRYANPSRRVPTPRDLAREWDIDCLRKILDAAEADLRHLTRKVAALRAAISIRKAEDRKYAGTAMILKRGNLNPARKRGSK